MRNKKFVQYVMRILMVLLFILSSRKSVIFAAKMQETIPDQSVIPASTKVFQSHRARGHIRAITLANHNAREYREIASERQWAGLVEIGGKKYYISPETGEMQTGWLNLEGENYYFSSDTGEMQTGLQTIEDYRYYFLPDTGEMQTGWQEIENEKYYFSLEDGRMQVGSQKIDGNHYYFLPDTGEMQMGWQEIDGETYYFSKVSGTRLTGRHKIRGDAYLFNEDGVLSTSGWIVSGGKKYYAENNGVLKSGWQDIGNKTYYFSEKNNSMVTGAQKIDGSFYIFDSKGRLARSKSISIVTVGKNVYCAREDGKAATGWQLFENKLYYATKTGKVKRNTTYQGISFTGDGAAQKNDPDIKAKIKTMEVFTSITDSDMSKSQKLNACWDYMTGGKFRYGIKYPDLQESGWQKQAAYEMLCTYSGNCYGFACAFAALSAEAGYKPYVVCGRVRGSRDRAGDGYTRHAWVRINGLYYDPEAHYAGWMRGIYGRSSYPVSHTVQSIVAY